jgi:hypothetical protein
MGLLHHSYSREPKVIQVLPRRVRRFRADYRLGDQFGLTIGPQKFLSLDGFRQRPHWQRSRRSVLHTAQRGAGQIFIWRSALRQVIRLTAKVLIEASILVSPMVIVD